MTGRMLLGAAVVLGAWGCCKHEPSALQQPSEMPASAEPAPSASPPRCAQIGKEVIVGDNAARNDDEQELLPFATEIGRGVTHDDGFAIGALTRDGKGTASVVAMVSADGEKSRLVRLAASHGDAEPPSVFSAGKVVGAAVLEPAGARRALRLARVDGQAAAWGAELEQGNDESLAFDVIAGGSRGVIAWDDLPKDREVSGIHLATFEMPSMSNATQPRVVTLPGTDADSPRLVARTGGYWLFWVARKPESDLATLPVQPNAAGKEPTDPPRYRAEELANKWIEVVPIDERGVLQGSPRRIGSERGHVLVYDVAEGRDGAAIVMWRDDDTPSGSIGGKLMRALVRMGGVDGPDVMDGEALGTGAPNLMPGWLAIADAATPTRIVPLGPDGAFLDRVASEPLLGNGEPVAARGDTLLLARPSGLAVRLLVGKCSREIRDAGAPDAAAEDWP